MTAAGDETSIGEFGGSRASWVFLWSCKEDVTDIRRALEESGLDFVRPGELEELLKRPTEDATRKSILLCHHAQAALSLVQLGSELKPTLENIAGKAIHDLVPDVAVTVRFLLHRV